MQLKIITRRDIFRFDQTGQPVPEITEPFVNVEVYTREDVLALYDQNEEHLVHAFKYDGEEITELSDSAANSIQNFFLAEGAWYLQALNRPEDDKKVPEASAEANSDTPATSVGDASNDPANLGAVVFIPTEQQRDLLRDIQVTVKALGIIKPDPSAAWDRQVQKLLLSQQLFGIDDLAKAHQEGENKLTQLAAQAKAAGVPENVLNTNLTPPKDSDLDDDEKDDEP